MTTVTPWLWFDTEAEAAATYYTSLLPDSRITRVTRFGTGGNRPEGMVMTVTFELGGREFVALNGGPEFAFTEAVSLQVVCATQEEVDRLWTGLSEGGSESQCGWLKDRWGLSWQVVPAGADDLLHGPDPEGAARAFAAMLGMRKLDLAALQRAYDGA